MTLPSAIMRFGSGWVNRVLHPRRIRRGFRRRLLENILDRDHPRGAAVFIDQDGHMRAFLRIFRSNFLIGIASIPSWPDESAWSSRCWNCHQTQKELLGVHHADDLVLVTAYNRKTGVLLALDDLQVRKRLIAHWRDASRTDERSCWRSVQQPDERVHDPVKPDNSTEERHGFRFINSNRLRRKFTDNDVNISHDNKCKQTRLAIRWPLELQSYQTPVKNFRWSVPRANQDRAP